MVVVGVVEGSLVALAGALVPEAAFLVTAGFVAAAFFEVVAAGASSSRLRLVGFGAGLVASTGALMGFAAFLEAVVRVVVVLDAAGAGAELAAVRV
jgi:hypothetical protein